MINFIKSGKLITLLLSVILLVNFSNVFAQTKAKRRSTKASANEVVTAASNIPYSLEVTEESTKKGLIITLAVDQVTIIHCPEEALQILFGNNEGMDVSETKPGRTEIYLRPRLGQINTNVVIEMASGPVVLYLRTVEIKGGAKVGQFSSEIIIKNSAYKDALVQARGELEKSKQENATLRAESEKLSGQLKEKTITACQEGKKDLLRIVETALQIKDKRNTVSILGGKAKLHQIGRMQRTSQGILVNIAIENIGKDYISIDDLTAQTGNVVTSGITNNRKISPKSEINYSLLIEDSQNSPNTTSNSGNNVTEANNALSEITIVINQIPVKLKIS